MAGIEGSLGAQIENQRSLIHESHGLHRGESGERPEAGLNLIDGQHHGREHGTAREIGMMGNKLEQSRHKAEAVGFSEGRKYSSGHRACMLAGPKGTTTK